MKTPLALQPWAGAIDSIMDSDMPLMVGKYLDVGSAANKAIVVSPTKLEHSYPAIAC